MPLGPRHAGWIRFNPVYVEGKKQVHAECKTCFRVLVNTGQTRMEKHQCNFESAEKKHSNVVVKEEWKFDEDQEDPLDTDSELSEEPSKKVLKFIKREYPSSSSGPTSSPFSRKTSSTFVIKTIDELSYDADELNNTEELNMLLLKFFIECDVPLSAIGSQNLKTFLEKLKPSYAIVLPDEETFGTVTLNNVYQTALDEVRLRKVENYTLVLSREMKASRKVINVHAKPTFRPAIFFTNIDCEDGNFDGDDLLENIVEDVESQFHGKVVSTIDNCLSNTIIARPELRDFMTKCQKKLIETVAATASNPQLNARVEDTLRALNVDYSRDVNKWKGEMENYHSFTEKLNESKHKAIDQGKLIDEELCSERLQAKVRKTCKNLQSVLQVGACCNFMSDAIDSWIDVQTKTTLLPPESEAFEQIFSTVNLAAHVFDPRYKDRRLSPAQRQLVRFFVSKQLNDSCEFDKFDEYLEGKGFFNDNELKEKKAHSYWTMMKGYCKKLSSLAVVLASLPATTATAENIYSQNEVDSETTRKISLIKSIIK